MRILLNTTNKFSDEPVTIKIDLGEITLMLTLIVRGYFVISILTFFYLFQKFLRDSTTAKTELSSWQVLALASLFWPIALPLSYLEREMNKEKPVVTEFKRYQKLSDRSSRQYWESSDRRVS